MRICSTRSEVSSRGARTTTGPIRGFCEVPETGECPSLGGEDANGLGKLIQRYFLEGRIWGVQSSVLFAGPDVLVQSEEVRGIVLILQSLQSGELFLAVRQRYPVSGALRVEIN